MSSILSFPLKNVPTYDNGVWTKTTFNTKEEFIEFLTPLFKEPGEYKFDDISFLFNEQARKFNKDGFYCSFPRNSNEAKEYWIKQEKPKCKKGVIFKTKGKTFYLPREYYMWINFMGTVQSKTTGRPEFPKVWDSQYHLALYELLAFLNNKHVCLVKKRQWGNSYYHAAKLINQYWWEKGVVCKMGASDKSYINEKGTWKMLNEYRDFLNQYTEWYRGSTPNKIGTWTQQIEVTDANNRKSFKGKKSSIISATWEKDPASSVGGPSVYIYHEEGGIAPKASDTYGYAKPALQNGPFLLTGQFIIAGSVGDLDQCEPLKNFIYNPEREGFFATENKWVDENNNTTVKTGLFVPTQWSMEPYIDEYGNSLVTDALNALNELYEKNKKELPRDKYQLFVSQNPRYLSEAFANKKESIFPTQLIQGQLLRIEKGDISKPENVDLYREADGKIKTKPSKHPPISEYPIPKTASDFDKVGCLQIWEHPIKNPIFTETYYASIDPVGVGGSITSDSLCSIYVYKNLTHVMKTNSNGDEKSIISSHIEGGKIVASWTGRYDDLQKTHEQLELIIEYYNAWTIIENNIPGFIIYMMGKNKAHYLVTKDMMMFLKELTTSNSTYREYGWRNAGSIFKEKMLPYSVNYVLEEIDNETDEEGNVKSVKYGVERIPDPILLKEMLAYTGDQNVDRLVAFTALITFAAIQNANRGIGTIIEKEDDKLEKSQKISNLYKKELFSNIGKNPRNDKSFKRSAFRNLK